MSDLLSRLIRSTKNRMSSLRGSNVPVFCVFLLASALLWLAISLNEDVQTELRCQLRIVNCPDSITRITPLPQALNASVSGGGIPLYANLLFHTKVIDINYGTYVRDGVIELGHRQLTALVSKNLGGEAVVQNVSPDSLRLVFTSQKPRRMPVAVDARITTMPNCALTGPVAASVDSVWLYYRNNPPEGLRAVSTIPVRLTDISQSQTVRMPLQVPPGCRAIPDSVDVRIEVEPMISRTAKVPIVAQGIPDGYKVILLPPTVNVNYSLPMSHFNDKQPQFKVFANFRSLGGSYNSNKIKLNMKLTSGKCTHAYLSADSVEYILERL